jgi:hypothetical protein
MNTDPATQVAKMLGLTAQQFNRAAMSRGTPQIGENRGERIALHSTVDRVHKMLKRASKEAGVPHASFLSALADRALEETSEHGGSVALKNTYDAEDADPDAASDENENGDGDEPASALGLQDVSGPEDPTSNYSEAPRVPPQYPPSPVDRNPRPVGMLPATPDYSANRCMHNAASAKLADGSHLLLNVTDSQLRHWAKARGGQ